jgi:hypothetical protein
MDKNKNTLWTFGCSFTAEYEPIDNVHSPYENNYDRYRNWRGGNLPPTWPNIMAKFMDYNVMNCALGGSSNYNILMQFSNISHLIKKDDILIFGWSKLTRFIAANFVENIFNNVLPVGSNYNDLGMSQNTIDEILVNRTHKIWKYEVHSWIRIISSLCKNVGAEDFHWSSDEKVFSAEDNNIINDSKYIVVRDPAAIESTIFVDKHNMMWYLTHQDHYGGIQKGKIMDETNYEIMDGHMGELGHQLQAEIFFEHLLDHSEILKRKRL